MLREKPRKKRILLSDDQQRRFTVKGKIRGRRVLGVIVELVLRLAREYVTCEFDRVQSVFANLGVTPTISRLATLLKNMELSRRCSANAKRSGRPS